MSPKSKYYPLFEYLNEQPDSGLLELSFAEIEEILGYPLPATASKTRAWWANSQTSHGKTWQEAGENPSPIGLLAILPSKLLSFARNELPTGSPPFADPKPGPAGRLKPCVNLPVGLSKTWPIECRFASRRSAIGS